MLDTFDDYDRSDYSSYDLKPFQFLDSEDDTHEWLIHSFDELYNKSQDRLEIYARYLSMFKGIYYKNMDTRRNPKIAVNFIAEMVDGKKAQRGKHYPSVTAIPNNHQDQSDINNAKSCKMLLDARGRAIKLDELHTKLDEIIFILGHGFMYIPWNEELGDKHPLYEKLEQRYEGNIPKSVKKKLGDRNLVRVGDVEVIPVGADRVFVEPSKDCWDNINYLYHVEFVHIEELKADFPNAEITETTTKYYSEYKESNDGMVLVRNFWHKPTKYLPEGKYIKFCEDSILEESDFPYDDGQLPFVPDTDVDVYGEFWGRSFISRFEQLQKLYNLIYSGTAKDYALASAAKWFVQKGSVNKKDLHNDNAIVEFKGAIKPQKENQSAVNSKSFEFQDRIENKIAKAATLYDVSRGEVPTGVTANSALRFLDEQEGQRDVIGVRKRKNRVLDVYRMMLCRMKQFYRPSDNRMVRILGEKNEYMIKSFKSADFSKVYDIQLQNTSAMPDTKTGKISAIIDLNMATQTDPIFKKKEVIEMLDLGLDTAFTDGSEAPVDSARQTLELLLEGEPAPEPAEWDDLLVHYSIFTKFIQGIQFKMKVVPEIQEAIKNHIMVMEGVMWMKSLKNMKFKMELQQENLYPIFFEVPIDAQALGAAQPQPQPEQGPDMDLAKVKKQSGGKDDGRSAEQ